MRDLAYEPRNEGLRLLVREAVRRRGVQRGPNTRSRHDTDIRWVSPVLAGAAAWIGALWLYRLAGPAGGALAAAATAAVTWEIGRRSRGATQ